jgi:hypothetical protein
MKLRLIIIGVMVLFLVGCGGEIIDGNIIVENVIQENETVLNLENIDQTIVDKIEEQNLDKVHVVMNIEEKTSEFLNYLEENNIIRLYSDDNEFIVSVPVDKLEEISEHSNVVSIANVNSEDKIHYNLDLDNPPDYIIQEDSSYKLLVLCYFDVELDDCEVAVDNHGEIIEGHSSYSLIVYVSPEKISLLIQEDVIALVEMAPSESISHEE